MNLVLFMFLLIVNIIEFLVNYINCLAVKATPGMLANFFINISWSFLDGYPRKKNLMLGSNKPYFSEEIEIDYISQVASVKIQKFY